jgi:hypothetical protein
VLHIREILSVCLAFAWWLRKSCSDVRLLALMEILGKLWTARRRHAAAMRAPTKPANDLRSHAGCRMNPRESAGDADVPAWVCGWCGRGAGNPRPPRLHPYCHLCVCASVLLSVPPSVSRSSKSATLSLSISNQTRKPQEIEYSSWRRRPRGTQKGIEQPQVAKGEDC